MMTYTKKAQSGRSMIEMLGVLAIVGVLSAGGIAGYSMAMQSYKTTSLIEKINLIAQRARTTFKGNYSGLTAASVLVNAGKISNNDLANPFGGTLTAVGTATNFTMTATNVPKEACVDLLETEWGSTGVFTSITAGTNTANTSSPVAAGTAITQCNDSTKFTGTMTFVFK